MSPSKHALNYNCTIKFIMNHNINRNFCSSGLYFFHYVAVGPDKGKNKAVQTKFNLGSQPLVLWKCVEPVSHPGDSPAEKTIYLLSSHMLTSAHSIKDKIMAGNLNQKLKEWKKWIFNRINSLGDTLTAFTCSVRSGFLRFLFYCHSIQWILLKEEAGK